MPKTNVTQEEIELLRNWAKRGDRYARFLLNLFDRLPPKVYTNATRPAASSVAVGTQIWNSDDKSPNWSDGTNWYDSSGNITG